MEGFAEVLVEFFPTSQGGRRTPVFLGEDVSGRYMPHVVVRDGDGEYLAVEFIDGPDEPIQPGGTCYATVRFMAERQINYDALVVGAEFDLREGGQTIGTGRVTRRDDASA